MLQPKGSSFNDSDKDFYRFKLGSHSVIPAWEEAVSGMKVGKGTCSSPVLGARTHATLLLPQVGGIRRIIVPPELSYPEKGKWDAQGPAPTTFSGKRALGFVLENKASTHGQMLARTSTRARQPARLVGAHGRPLRARCAGHDRQDLAL